VSATANTGATSRSGVVTVSGGGLSRTITVNQASQPNDAFINVAPTSLSFNSGAASMNVSVTSNVGWSVTDNQAWISVTPGSGANNGTIAVSVTANSGTASRSGTVTVSGGGLSRTIAVTQAGQSTGGSVTALGVVTSNSPWFVEEQLQLSNTTTITALSVTITVQRTTGINASGQYNTIGGQITQSRSCTTSACTYVFTLNSGQTLSNGSGRVFAAQMSGNGTAHPSAGDTYTVTGTAGGQPINLQGHF
jgi:hypothetical protein